MAALANRMKREFELLLHDPPHGVGAWPNGDSMTKLEASMTGPEDSSFEGGTFRLSVEVTPRYPFEAPKIRFLTKVYHPNIDTGGRICLDTLKMPPRGTWVPSMNISTTLQHIRLLMATPNADDGLMPEITSQYKSNKRLFEKTAKEWTARYASSSAASSSAATKTATTTTNSTTSISSSSDSSTNSTNSTNTHKRPHATDKINESDSMNPSKRTKGENVQTEQLGNAIKTNAKEESEEEESDESSDESEEEMESEEEI